MTMAKTVKEIMNSELLSFRETDVAERALGHILAFDITAAPVLDAEGHPLGVASMRDLLSRDAATTVAECMTRPAATILETESVDGAAQSIAKQGVHRLIVVDGTGRATGVVSALDVVCALIGRPVRHPAPFPHYDKALDVFWTDDMLLESAELDAIPNGPGVLALVSGGQHRSENIVWAEAVHSLPARLAELNARPASENRDLLRIMQHEPNLRVRASHIPSQSKREEVASALMAGAANAWMPQHAHH